MGITKTAGPGMTPAANLKAWYPQAYCNGEIIFCGKVIFGATGTVSSVTGPYVSAVSYPTGGTGCYRVYFPPVKDVAIVAHYTTSTTWANQVNVSSVSGPSGYADIIVHSAAAVSTPASGDGLVFVAHAYTSKVSV